MIAIRPLSQSDCAAVARLHLHALRTPFSGKAGERLLAIYYASVTAEQGAAGYVAVNPDEQISGFICGVWQPGLLRRYMCKRYGLRLALQGCRQLLHKPHFLVSLLKRLRSPHSAAPQGKPGYELRPIVVAETFRGTGIAKLLVQTLKQDAKKRGFSGVYLYTEPDNLAARKFYAKIGFAEMGHEERAGQLFIRYRCHV